MNQSGKRIWIAAIGVVIVLAVAGVFARWRSAAARSSTSNEAQFVGAATCSSCHRTQAASWRSSQHAVAMQVADARSVLGSFDSTRFTSSEITATFFRRDNRYFVNTAGADGLPRDHEIRWTFGVYPLQQYIVELPGGRFQALTVAWDARPRHEGGQRWFFLTPGHGAEPQDPLHWSGRQYNWNYSCADCHSTAVRKGYDEGSGSFRTTFTEINVACEACHGPGSLHARWGRYPSFVRWLTGAGNGLAVSFDERRAATWLKDPVTGAVSRSVPRQTDHEIETCAQCHSRRVHIADGYTVGKRLFDHYIPVTISGFFYPDGQQRSEVYNYGSFLQSRMYAAGVTCSDCHDPHTAKLRLPGNKVCTQCHVAARYDTKAHHRHIIAGTTGTCVSCHMPSTTYMEIDARPDHSMRIPRPDLSLSLGVPDACSTCHTGKDAGWAAEWIRRWYPSPRPGFQTFAEAFAADDRDDSTATALLARVAGNPAGSWFVRASALGRLAAHPGAESLDAARKAIRDQRPLVRLAALEILERFGVAERLELGVPLLSDSTLAVRKGAAWLIAPIADSLTRAQRAVFDSAASEFERSQRYNADQPGDRFVLGIFLAQLRKFELAEAELRAALRLDPSMAEAQSALREVERLRRGATQP